MPVQEVETMKRPIGPTVPRWQLGLQLAELRTANDLDQASVAKHLGCSVGTVNNIEAGKVGASKSVVKDMLDLYGVRQAEAERERYFELQRLGKTRGWWSSYGKLPTPFQQFLGIESAAESIDSFELAMVPGLLQTENYARAHERALAPWQPNDWIDRQVQLRMDRQKHILNVENPPRLWVVLDELILHRIAGGPEIMKEQLEHILSRVEDKVCELQVVPFSAGDYAGTLGKLDIYSFDQELHTPIAFVESHGGQLYMEEPEELRRCLDAYTYIRSTALNPKDSVRLLKQRVQSL
jgi:transcriptional regulator with XRE-family HTH domain